MVSYPGDLTPEQKAEWAARFSQAAEEMLGAERRKAMEEKLKRTAIAVGRLEAIQFTPTEAPGFFLNDLEDASSAGQEP